MEIARTVKKYGDSVVILLSRDDRKVLDVEVGDIVIVKKIEKPNDTKASAE